MNEITCQTLVIGAGPGGYVCAIRAGQLGQDTVIVDAGDLGGTCLNVGCIPSKAMIHAADEFEKLTQFADASPIGISASKPVLNLKKTVAWKDRIVDQLTTGVEGLLKKARVRIVKGHAKFLDGKTVEVEGETKTLIRAQSIVIATGSAPRELPSLPFGKHILSSTEVLALKRLPKSLVVIGGGYIGLELGIALSKLGSKVTVVEAAGALLPAYDKALSGPVVKTCKRLGIEVHTGTMAKSFNASESTLLVEDSDSNEVEIEAEKVLVAIGRRPVTDGLGLDQLVIDMDGEFIKIDQQCQTSMSGVYAIGDVTGDPMLAHRAMAQGEMVAELIAGEPRIWDKTVIPAICFTDPEIVVVGLSPQEAIEQGHAIKTETFPFLANGRAKSMEAEEGFVRIVVREADHLVLGIQAVGRGVSELSAFFGLACEMGARVEDIAQTVHAHPTLGEAVQEVALKTLGHALHI
ncbi:MAG: dihydrolipoyl dehydrogenase [Pseudomonadota bacterium]